MERWQSWFMIGGGVFLLLMGILMYKNKEVSMRKGIGVYNMLIGGLSIVGGIFPFNSKKSSENVFSAFIGILIVSFIILNILKIFNKED